MPNSRQEGRPLAVESGKLPGPPRFGAQALRSERRLGGCRERLQDPLVIGKKRRSTTDKAHVLADWKIEAQGGFLSVGAVPGPGLFEPLASDRVAYEQHD